MPNSLNPHQARHLVGPDLGPNCSLRLSTNDTNKHKVNVGVVFGKVNVHNREQFFAKNRNKKLSPKINVKQ